MTFDLYTKCYDCGEYYSLAQDLTPRSKFSYTKWYHRTPGYVLWLRLFGGTILAQMIFGFLVYLYTALTLNAYIGTFFLVWFYPYSTNYLKESVLLPLVLLILVSPASEILKVVLILLAMLPFQSYGETIKHNRNLSGGRMKAVWELWKPTFGAWSIVSNKFTYIFALPYVVLMLYWIKNVELTDVSFILAGIFTVVYGMIGYAESRFREVPMIAIILYVSQNL